MRVGIDARLLAYRQGGTSVYARNLLRYLPEAAPNDTFVALTNRKQPRYQDQPVAVGSHPLWTPPHHHLEQWSLPLELLPARLDVLHSVDFIPPLHRPCPAVITVHDLAFLLYPETMTAESHRYYGQIQTAVENADAIIAVSEATRDDLDRLLGVRPERVAVVHHGVSPIFRVRGEAEVAAYCAARGLPATFMLWVGALEPRKNLPCLFRAVAGATPRLPEAMRTLVIAGVKGWAFEQAQQEFDRLGLAGQTVLLSDATEEDLAMLYNAAWVFPYPSLYEGFGLPPLEAMACGTPVLSANVSAMPQVLGDAARYFDPADDQVLAGLLVKLAQDEALRRRMADAGCAHAAGFTWQATARATLDVYRHVGGAA